MSGVAEGKEALESGNYLIYSGLETLLEGRRERGGTANRFDSLLLVNVGETDVEEIIRAEMISADTVGIIDVFHSDDASYWSRVADHFNEYPIVSERQVNPEDLDHLGFAINRFLSEHASEDEHVAVYVNSLSGLLQHNSVESVFHFLHLLTRVLDSMGSIGYYRIDPDAHDRQTLGTIAELVDGVVEDGVKRDENHPDTTPTGSITGTELVVRLIAYTPWLWALAILSYGLTDIVTTYVGLRTGLAVEASPIAALIFDDHGFGFIYITKLSVFGLFYLLWKAVPSPFNVGIPLGLFVFGTLVTTWNTFIIIQSWFP